MEEAAPFSPTRRLTRRVHPEVDGVPPFYAFTTEICKNEAFARKLLASITAQCKSDQFNSRCHDLHTLWVQLSFQEDPRLGKDNEPRKSPPRLPRWPTSTAAHLDDPWKWRVFVLSMRLSSFRALMCPCVLFLAHLPSPNHSPPLSSWRS